MTCAFYPGSFDPPTLGHQWMINEAVRIFQFVLIGIGTNPAKKPLFTVQQRTAMLEALIPDAYAAFAGVIDFTNEMAVDVAMKNGCHVLIRGVRNALDFEYERGMAQINRDRQGNVKTVFLTPPRHLAEVSSSLVKSLLPIKGANPEQYVPHQVAPYLAGIK